MSGAAELASDLRAAGGQLDKSTKDATGKAGVTAASAARSLAPRKTGRLASSISTRLGGNVATLTASAPYAGPLHWGWRRRNIRPSLFLTRGAQQTEPKWFTYYEAALTEALAKIERTYKQDG